VPRFFDSKDASTRNTPAVHRRLNWRLQLVCAVVMLVGCDRRIMSGVLGGITPNVHVRTDPLSAIAAE
jgi:hypothetical protein